MLYIVGATVILLTVLSKTTESHDWLHTVHSFNDGGTSRHPPSESSGWRHTVIYKHRGLPPRQEYSHDSKASRHALAERSDLRRTHSYENETAHVVSTEAPRVAYLHKDEKAGGFGQEREVTTTESCPTDNGMTDEIRKNLVDLHNHYRSFVAKGEAENPLGANGYAPKAARMRKMVYDCNIEKNALKHVKRCKFGHSDDTERPGLGENVYALWTSVDYPFLNVSTNALKSWFVELKEVGMPDENVLTREIFDRPKKIGHYTQMVWQDSYHVGCGVTHCSAEEMYLLVCQYGPTGNWLGQLVYEKGEPCQTDADCGCSGCRCDKTAALCVMPPSLPWTAKEGVATV